MIPIKISTFHAFQKRLNVSLKYRYAIEGIDKIYVIVKCNSSINILIHVIWFTMIRHSLAVGCSKASLICKTLVQYDLIVII